jgi:pyruvate, orthophosphate dikinase
MRGAIATVKPQLSGEFETVIGWADEIRRLGIRANADTPADARIAREFGAEGIGLCRTEHMFFESARIAAVREMILADTVEGRRAALEKILPMQRQDFVSLFEIMGGLPVTIRLLDPPLHEFLPGSEAEIAEVAESIGVDADKVRLRVAELKEVNPMLGHRGVRIAISYPEIAEMQARAIFEAVVESGRKTGSPPTPEVMVPLIATRAEFDIIHRHIRAMAEEVEAESGTRIDYLVGTMIELPRACLLAADIGRTAEFFSFGTNDLTQTAFGISRDDSARFMGEYTAKRILPVDPFISIDVAGVGELVRIAVERGRQTRPDLKLGICGEHGGDPASIRFCHEAGLDYVSCSPFRIPIARLAAAQAAVAAADDDGTGGQSSD